MGLWSGWWEQRHFGRQPMDNLRLDIAASGEVAGSGIDCIGDFTVRGRFDGNGRILFVKRYLGAHEVFYEGLNSGEGIFGTWHIMSPWEPTEENCRGPFALRPHLSQSARDVTAESGA